MADIQVRKIRFSFEDVPIDFAVPDAMLASMLLMKAAVLPVESWQIVYGLVYPLLWVIPAFLWSRQAFDRYIVARRGGR